MDRKLEHQINIHDETLDTFNEIKDESGITLAELVEATNFDQIANEKHTSAEAQKKVFELQALKKYEVALLKDQVDKILDAHSDSVTASEQLEKQKLEYSQSQSQKVTVENGQLQIQNPEPPPTPILACEILTDLEWGMSYSLDPEMVSPELQIEYAKKASAIKIHQLTDEQILTEGLSFAKNTGNDSLLDIYSQFQKRNTSPEKAPYGVYVEQIAKNFLEKCSQIGIPFKVKDSDPQLDAVYGVDWFIESPSVTGVSIEESPEIPTNTVVVQFGAGKDGKEAQYLHSKKAKRIEQIRYKMRKYPDQTPTDVTDNFMVVIVNTEEVKQEFMNWRQHKTPGGPDKLWPIEFKKKLFHEMLSKLYTPEELNVYWQKVEASGIL